MIILDTNVISELMRPKPSHSVELWFASARGLLVATTVISITEEKFDLFRLPRGFRRKSLEQAFEDLIGPSSPLPVIDFNAQAAHLTGVIQAEREASGHPISLADAMIASIALVEKSPLVTRNTSDFEGLGLELINPWL